MSRAGNFNPRQAVLIKALAGWGKGAVAGRINLQPCRVNLEKVFESHLVYEEDFADVKGQPFDVAQDETGTCQAGDRGGRGRRPQPFNDRAAWEGIHLQC